MGAALSRPAHNILTIPNLRKVCVRGQFAVLKISQSSFISVISKVGFKFSVLVKAMKAPPVISLS